MGVPDKFPTESVWAHDAVFLLLTVVCCKCHCQKANRMELERIPTSPEKFELCVPLPLLFLGGSSAFFLGPEDVSYHSG